jgi:hypothetical protein
LVLYEDFSMAREVVLFQSGGGEGRFRVEETGQLGDEGFALFEDVTDLGFCAGFFFGRFWGESGAGGILGVGVEQGFCLWRKVSWRDCEEVDREHILEFQGSGLGFGAESNLRR